MAQDGSKMNIIGSKRAILLSKFDKMAPRWDGLSSYFVALQALHFQQLQPKIVNALSNLKFCFCANLFIDKEQASARAHCGVLA